MVGTRWAALIVTVCAFGLAGCQSRSLFCKEGEWQFSAYTGKAHTFNSDISLRHPAAGTDLEVKDVGFDDESLTFHPPPNYGARITYWTGKHKQQGIAVDFHHPKAIARTHEVKEITGVKNGVPVASPAPMSTAIERWRVAFGHNILTLNYMHRWFPKGRRDETLLGRMQPYAGIGVGVAIPSPLIQVDGVRVADGYRIAGPAATAILGLNLDVWGPFSVYAEGKLNWTDLNLRFKSGVGESKTELWTTNILVGASVRF